MKTYSNKASANSAAHRYFKKKYGNSYIAHKGVDFTVSFSYSFGGWIFNEIAAR